MEGEGKSKSLHLCVSQSFQFSTLSMEIFTVSTSLELVKKDGLTDGLTDGLIDGLTEELTERQSEGH